MVAKILLERLGGTNLEDLGDKTAISEDHTETWNLLAFRKLSTDATGGSHNTATPTLIVTHAIGADEISSFIEVNIDTIHNKLIDTVGTTAGAKDYYVRIDIGETGSETTKKTFMDFVDTNEVITVRTNCTQKFYYEPTTDEKTNGFNVQIYLYVDVIQTSVSSAKAEINESWVMGV